MVLISCLTAMLILNIDAANAFDGTSGQGQKFTCDHINNEQTDPEESSNITDPKQPKDCSVPVGEGTVTNPSTQVVWTYSRQGRAIPFSQFQAGDLCQGQYLVGPTFSKSGDGWDVAWQDPAKVLHQDFVLADPGSPLPTGQPGWEMSAVPGYLQSVGPLLGYNTVQIAMKLDGEWAVEANQGSCGGQWNPKDVLWHVQGGYHESNPKVVLTPYVPNPPGGPSGSLPKAQIQQLLGDRNQINPGQIETAPQPDEGLVNLPEHCWIEGATVSSRSLWRLERDSPPDATGRGLRYAYYVTVGLGGASWSWGDGRPDGWWPGLGGKGANAQNPTHNYSQISAKAGAGPEVKGAASYLVKADEQYQVGVQALWFDGRASQQQNLGDLGLDFTLAPSPVGLHVGQLQGVPQA
jgi:hypothetical protein